jgi:flavin-dependent dehydrogenase
MSYEIHDVAIAGGGPAGTSAAINLAQQGLKVLLAEHKRFPREKLCGEFISPECIKHFERLGVANEITLAKGAELTETSFYARTGNKVSVPSHWFGDDRAAIGLSRAEMDRALLEGAKRNGVTVLEEAQVVDLIRDKQRIAGVQIRTSDGMRAYRAHLTIDATGRTRALARKVARDKDSKRRARFVAFKAHLQNARVAPGVCEIYFYPGGYGGLNNIEGELSNLCFIATARDLRQSGSSPEQIIRSRVMRNTRAAFTLGEANFVTSWLSVALESFGRQELVPADGLLMIGDAAAFIDPFTGSGMLMALESGAVAAAAISEYGDSLAHESSFSQLANRYRAHYKRTFDSRLRVSSWLRRAAFVPRVAETAISFFGLSDSLRRRVAQATRRPATGSLTTDSR